MKNLPQHDLKKKYHHTYTYMNQNFALALMQELISMLLNTFWPYVYEHYITDRWTHLQSKQGVVT
jgi:hypothetical protein